MAKLERVLKPALSAGKPVWVLGGEANSIVWGTEEWVRLQALWLNCRNVDGCNRCTGLVQVLSRVSWGNDRIDRPVAVLKEAKTTPTTYMRSGDSEQKGVMDELWSGE